MVIKCTSAVLNVEMMEALQKGCPIMAPVNISGFEADTTFKSYLPPIIPEGFFKLSLRIHDSKNKTFIYIAVISEVKTLGVSDFIKLG